jgi:hypothetical protein
MPNRKEVRKMKYTKPMVTLLASANDAIQSDTEKLLQHTYDALNEPASSSAYEADE